MAEQVDSSSLFGGVSSTAAANLSSSNTTAHSSETIFSTSGRSEQGGSESERGRKRHREDPPKAVEKSKRARVSSVDKRSECGRQTVTEVPTPVAKPRSRGRPPSSAAESTAGSSKLRKPWNSGTSSKATVSGWSAISIPEVPKPKEAKSQSRKLLLTSGGPFTVKKVAQNTSAPSARTSSGKRAVCDHQYSSSSSTLDLDSVAEATPSTTKSSLRNQSATAKKEPQRCPTASSKRLLRILNSSHTAVSLGNPELPSEQPLPASVKFQSSTSTSAGSFTHFSISTNHPASKKKHSRTSASGAENPSTSSSGTTVCKYPLRSQTKASSSIAQPTAPSTSSSSKSKTSSKKPKVSHTDNLGGSQSNYHTREAQPSPSPQTRRSTRSQASSKSTTGSCASTSRRSCRVKQPLAGGCESEEQGRGMSTPAEQQDGGATASAQPHHVNTTNSSTANTTATNETAGHAPSVLMANVVGGVTDSESEDSEVGRLQVLLEARGLPPHFLPRMQHLLHRSMGANSSATRAQQLLNSLQAIGDEGQQLQAVIEMCQMLVMGNEDTLNGFPVKQVVPALVTLLSMEHNFDMMNHACRALTYMMEALPRSSAVVLDAVPVFLEKLQVIQCMDVAEQSLTALEMLSRRHNKAILRARGVAACLMYLDFFSINAQRAALAVTANCCQNLHTEEFHFVSPSLSFLANRLALQDKKSVESVCLAFSRLVESYQSDSAKLREIASTQLLTNLQQLLVVVPPVINSGTFITVLRMMAIMCANCPDLAHVLLEQNIAETLCYLLTGQPADSLKDDIELTSRSPQELYEITCLIGELMPRLPSDGLFAVDALLERPTVTYSGTYDAIMWQWRDDRTLWHPYSPIDSRIIEAAHQAGEDEVTLTTLGRTYTIDLHTMQQINEDTGTSRPVQRRINYNALLDNAENINNNTQNSSNVTRDNIDNSDLAAVFIRSLFSVLYEVYSSSAGPAVRCKCLRALLRMVYYAPPQLLQEVLKNQVVSSHIAGMMASQDLRIVVGALQMAEILMTKLPNVFEIHFTREGVMHQIKQLADPGVPLSASPPKSTPSSESAFFPGPSGSQASPATSQSQEESSQTTRSASPSQLRICDVLKRKRTPRRQLSGSRKSRHDESSISSAIMMQDLFAKATTLSNTSTSNGRSATSSSSRSRFSGATSKTSSFLASLNPARWGRSSEHRPFSKDSNLPKCASSTNISAGNKEKARQWVRERASKFVEMFDKASTNINNDNSTSSILSRLTLAINKLDNQAEDSLTALEELRDIVITSDISPFEVNHSGLVKSLLDFLTRVDDSVICRENRLRRFLHVFAGCPADVLFGNLNNLDVTSFSALVSKLNGCISQLEQFPVKVHDLPAGTGSTTPLKFFNTHQLKCHLQRHPSCTNLKQWKGGAVKIDPLALVEAIERYLVIRGYSRIRDKDVADSDDDNSDEDTDDTSAAVVISQSATRHKLQFLIGEHVLPHNMTVYQAIRQFSPVVTNTENSETDTDNETPLGSANVWVQTHTVYYRPVPEDQVSSSSKTNINVTSPRKGKGTGSKSNSRRKTDDLWTEGVVPSKKSPLESFLTAKLPDNVQIQDASLPVLALLRVFQALNRYWGSLYTTLEYKPLIPHQEFINNKITAKANRQLQDPLVIMTGNLPCWLQQIASSCPFLFPFETRQLLFHAISFDRDRALQRLLDSSPELSNSTDSQERVTPRLDRRKRTVSRNDILKQAESVIHDLASSKALLEVQYEDEVGTGLGPTLEFYALVSRELQKSDLELWHNSSNSQPHVFSPTGLFPAPIPRSNKSTHLVNLKAKFRFIAKFMAKALMDSRMLDIPFSISFYRWLLGQEACLTLSDLAHVAPDIYKTLAQLENIVQQKLRIESNTSLSTAEQTKQINSLHLDGCAIEDLGLDFTLPGYSSIELRKGGRDIPVTIHNVEQYIKLVTHWYLNEGISRQMESFREGFDCVFPLANLAMFYPEELDAVFCGSNSHINWDIKTLAECCRPDHGYTPDSRAIKLLFEILASYTEQEQRDFVQFVTGSPRLPVGGFKALSPPLTIVRRTFDTNLCADEFLPSVMTCVNYLKLPDYSSLEVMRQKLQVAAKEGQHSFHLS
nr:PREDICTED: E3 ubiquitin-protein ligase TRIP12 isoform X1 [Bemisia tabaci]XP_018917456.1 PREDICTED: E3 ubiquitin-protein ligase TRIP12 isoform X1 [Bemisia tabaci]